MSTFEKTRELHHRESLRRKSQRKQIVKNTDKCMIIELLRALIVNCVNEDMHSERFTQEN